MQGYSPTKGYTPTPRQIAVECARIRAGWDRREKLQRKVRYDSGRVPWRAMIWTRIVHDRQQVFGLTTYA